VGHARVRVRGSKFDDGPLSTYKARPDTYIGVQEKLAIANWSRTLLTFCHRLDTA
jgi:hypothetical protein